MNQAHFASKHHLLLNQHASQIWPILPGLQHENLDGRTTPLKITIQTAQITTENLAPLNAEFGSHSGSETRLRAKELKIAAVQQTHHRSIAFNRKFIDPFSGQRQTAPVERHPADEDK